MLLRRPTGAVLIAIALVLPGLVSGVDAAQAGDSSFDVTHYVVRIEPDIEAASVRGTVTISLRATSDVDTIALDRGRLVIDAVTADGAALEYEDDGRRVNVHLARPAAAGDERSITVDYHGNPPYGMEFYADRPQVYTLFSTSQWMVTVDAPSERATLELSLVVPGDLVAVGNGDLVEQTPLGDGRAVHVWRLDTAVPSFVYGVAAGDFTEVEETHSGVTLRYLAGGFTEAELRRIFADTPATLDFLARRAGLPYPEASYTQALVERTFGQEMAGFAIMSDEYGRAMLADPAASSLAAHELAHQWWGNMVTAVDWTHFWLNEGFATFMAAAWVEERFGRDAYLESIARSRQRYEDVRDRGGDKSLVFPDWDSPTGDDRTIVYQKGAYVLHLLREELGDEAFWSGVRDYTSAYFGASVTTAEFQASMEASTGRDLGAFFDEWVYFRTAR